MKSLATRIALLTLFACVAQAAPAVAATCPFGTISAPDTATPGQAVQFQDTKTPVVANDYWDFDYNTANGTFTVDATGLSPSHTYDSRGKYTVMLARTDSSGHLKSYDCHYITVDSFSTDFSADPAAPVAGQTVTFTATPSVGDGGSVASYDWDLNGDGTTDSTAAAPTFTYPGAGDYTVTLKTVDDLGTASTTTHVISVAASTTPAGDAPAAGSGGSGAGQSGSPFDVGSAPVLGLSMINPAPFIRIKGHTTGRGAQIDLFTVRAPVGSTITVRCKGGHGCRRKVGSVTVKGTTGRATRVLRFRWIQGWRRAGTIISVRVMKKGFIGRYTRFRIGKLKPPVRWDGCLFPGHNSPTDCQGGA